jgi:hypothetical protein
MIASMKVARHQDCDVGLGERTTNVCMLSDTGRKKQHDRMWWVRGREPWGPEKGSKVPQLEIKFYKCNTYYKQT